MSGKIAWVESDCGFYEIFKDPLAELGFESTHFSRANTILEAIKTERFAGVIMEPWNLGPCYDGENLPGEIDSGLANMITRFAGEKGTPEYPEYALYVVGQMREGELNAQTPTIIYTTLFPTADPSFPDAKAKFEDAGVKSYVRNSEFETPLLEDVAKYFVGGGK